MNTLRPSFRLLILLLGAGLLLEGCVDDGTVIEVGGGEIATSGLALSALSPVDGCAPVLVQLKAKAKADADKRIDDNEKMALGWVDNGCQMWDIMAGDGGGPTNQTGAPGGGASEVSKTNTQVAGVDEADFIKNDNKYIYILASGGMQIIDAWPPEKMLRLSKTPIEGIPRKLYVYGDRALVYSSLQPLSTPNVSGPYGGGMAGPSYSGQADKACTYGYDCDFRGDGRGLKITVFDISDRTKPIVLRESTFSGSYLNSRRIGENIHTVVTFNEVVFPGVAYWPAEFKNPWDLCSQNKGKFPFSVNQIKALFASLKIKNAAIIDQSKIEDFLPSVQDTRYPGGKSGGGQALVESGLLSKCQGFYMGKGGDGQSLLSLISQRIDKQGPIASTTIVGRPGAVYASKDALYVAVRHRADQSKGWYFPASDKVDEATTVHKFVFEGGVGTSYVGSGVVKGRALNQFSMDEHKGRLRIVTTTGRLPNKNTYNSLYLLDAADDQLVVEGEIDSFAKGEDVRSVRFNGDVGFVVTFKKTDPLFVFGLSNPAKPVILGELKIPGYSTYMHLMDDTHLMTVGYDADDQGSFAWFTGIRLQIFDVSDYANPTLLHAEVIGTRGSASDAATDHLAFNYFKAKGLLGLPITVCENSSGGGSYGKNMTFSGLFVYKVSTAGGFVKLGGVSHVDPSSSSAKGMCNGWWTQSKSWVKRSVFMDDYVISVAMDLLIAAKTSDLATPVSYVDLTK